MAKKHKAPTEVTLVQEEKGAFATWIDTNWKMLAFVAVGATALILISQIRSGQAAAARDKELDLWLAAVQSANLAQLESASVALAAVGLDGWTDLMAVQLALSEDRYEDASSGMARLEESASPLLQLALPLGPEGESLTILEHVQSTLDSSKQQLEDVAVPLYCPDPPEGSTNVRLHTSLGTIEVALYDEAAPLHVANFLANVDAGKYTGTRFHRIIRGFMVQGGNPATKSDDPTLWIEPGDEVKVPSESENGLVHSPFVLAAAMSPGDEESSQFQFYITEGHAHWLDGRHTVYGKVTSGQDVVRVLGSVPTNPQQNGRPLDPPTLERIERL
jgi:cyclophilin family peptidyl-prolyl cis-trans isomerase